MSQDPIGFAGGLNVYGFVGQNPLNWIDFEGLQPIDPNDDFGREAFRSTVKSGANTARAGLDMAADSYDLSNPWNWVFLGGALKTVHSLFKLKPPGPSARQAKGGFAKFKRKEIKPVCPKGFTGDQDYARKKLGLSKEEFNKRIHVLKDDFDNNPDVWINPKTGDVLHRGSLEPLGNLKEF